MLRRHGADAKIIPINNNTLTLDGNLVEGSNMLYFSDARPVGGEPLLFVFQITFQLKLPLSPIEYSNQTILPVNETYTVSLLQCSILLVLPWILSLRLRFVIKKVDFSVFFYLLPLKQAGKVLYHNYHPNRTDPPGIELILIRIVYTKICQWPCNYDMICYPPLTLVNSKVTLVKIQCKFSLQFKWSLTEGYEFDMDFNISNSLMVEHSFPAPEDFLFVMIQVPQWDVQPGMPWILLYLSTVKRTMFITPALFSLFPSSKWVDTASDQQRCPLNRKCVRAFRKKGV